MDSVPGRAVRLRLNLQQQEQQMSLGILNNISALYAQNSLNSTQNSLQNTLQQLSSGSRINSGADDAAGLAVADGLHANEAALTQSSQNATAGIGLLQTADGALSQVTNLLDRAVTLATESANGTLTGGQVSSANQEYQNILAQIGNIGSTTNFNSSQVFTSNATNIVVTDGTSSGLNTYADIVGALNTASVGTTAAAAVTMSSIAPTSTSGPAGVIAKSAGVYTFATNNNASDTVSGKLAFAVGNGTQISVNTDPAGDTLTQLSAKLMGSVSFTGAGLTSSIDAGTGNLVIQGPISGANAAANTVSFAGTNLTDNVGTITATNGVAGQTATPSSSSLVFAGSGVAGADNITGAITYQVGSSTAQTFTLAGGTTLNTGTSTDISARLNADTTFQSYGLTASVSGSTLKISGPAGNNEAITLTAGSGATAVQDTSHTGVTVGTTVGHAGTAGTYTLTQLSGSGNVLSGSIQVNGDSYSGANGAALASAINAGLVASGTGSASIDGTGKIITISGSTTLGTAPTIGTDTLQDSGLGKVSPTPGTAAQVPTPATATLSPFSSGSASVIGGTIVIGSTNIDITAGSNGNSVASQISTNAAMITAGITASFDAGTKTLTVKDAAGVTLPSINAHGLTDSGDVAYDNTPTATITNHPLMQSVQTIQLTESTAALTGSITVGAATVNMGATPMTGDDLATALNSAGLTAAGETASFDDTSKLLTIKGSANGVLTPTIDVSSFQDNAVSVTPTTQQTAQELTVGSKTMAAFSSPSAAVVGGSITIDNKEIDITAGSTGASVMTQINTALSTTYSVPSTQMSASYNASTGVLSINGASDGTGAAPSVVSNLTDTGDEHPYAGAVSPGTPGTVATAGTQTMSIGGSDVLSGNIMINGVTVSGATSGSTLATAITTALTAQGISGSYDSNTSTLTITGNATTGVPLSITNNNIQDTTIGGVAASVGVSPAVAGTKTTSTLAVGGNAVAGDVLTGNITYTDSSNSVLNTFTLAAGTTLDNGSTGLSTRLNNDTMFHTTLGLTASVTGTTLTITGATGSTNTIVLGQGTLADAAHDIIAAAPAGSLGSAGTAATKVLTLNNATDTFGGSININSNGLGNVAVDLAGLNGAQAAAAITSNATLFGQGVSAAWSSQNKQLTITGNGTGQSLAVTPVTTLSDNATIAGATSTDAARGGPATGATSTIQLGSANDTVSGNLSVVVGTSGQQKDSVSLNIAANTTGSALASQINSNTAFQAAGVAATYNSNTHAVTLTGPTGTTNTLDTSGSTLYDSTSAVPQGGADFTAAGVSTLTAQTASNVLTTVTAAVADVAYQRGTIGADINQLTSASNVASSEGVNLTSAEESIRATNYGQAASDLSKYQILSQTGISALAQANSVQQEVLKLLQ
jgi:flagellin